MRRLFMVVFIPVIFVLGTPALLVSIMYDGSGDDQMPTYLYTEDADAEKMVYAELSAAIADVEDNVTEDMVYELHQDIINTAIFEAFRSEDMNPDYMPTDDCIEDSCNYVFDEVTQIEGFNIGVRVVGAWVDFQDDRFIGNLFLEVTLDDGFTYKTIIQVHFLFKDHPDRYELEFDKIQIGNLPIPKALITSIMNTIDDQVDEFDLDEQAQVDLGDLDLSSMSYTLRKDDILEQLDSGDENIEQETGNALAQEVLSIIFDNELINFDIEDEMLVLTAGVSKFRSNETDIPSYLYDLHFKTTVEGEEVIGEFDPDSFDSESYLEDMFTEYVFNSALVGGGFEIHEQTFNKLIYHGADGFSETRTTYEYVNEDGDIEIIDIGLKAIWFEFTPTEIYVYALFRIAGIDSVLKIKADEVSTNTLELVFEFTEITFGEDEGEVDGDYLSIIDLEVFNQMFLELEDVEFGEFVEVDEAVVLKITAERLSLLMQDGSQEGTVNVTGIYLIQDAIVLDIEPADAELAAALDDIMEELNNVFEDPELLTNLEEVLDTENPGPEQDVYNGVEDLQYALIHDEEITVDDVTDLFDDFEQMDSDAQEAFLNTFEDLIDPEIYDEFQALYDAGVGSGE
ncbi:MAG: hypothetical protein KAH16_00285 [Candidatus Izimaplasma sp.]|nr:hypothetical protein [Candidatus Izimaplasma bacterium]